MKRPSTTRRHLLGALGISATAGCLDRLTPGSESGIPLGSFRVSNSTEEERTIILRLERNNDVVYDDSFEIAGKEVVWIEPTWSSEPATYDVYYLLGGTDELHVAHLTDYAEDTLDGECMYADLWIIDDHWDFLLSTKDVTNHEEATCNF